MLTAPVLNLQTAEKRLMSIKIRHGLIAKNEDLMHNKARCEPSSCTGGQTSLSGRRSPGTWQMKKRF